MSRRKRSEELVNHVFVKPRDEETSNGQETQGMSNGKEDKDKSDKVVHARDMRLTVPGLISHRGDDQLFELFLDNANVPHIKLLQAKGRQIWPVDHEMVYNHLTHYLFWKTGGLLPTPAEVKGYANVLKSVAVMNGQREKEVDWKDNVLEQDTFVRRQLFLRFSDN